MINLRAKGFILDNVGVKKLDRPSSSINIGHHIINDDISTSHRYNDNSLTLIKTSNTNTNNISA